MKDTDYLSLSSRIRVMENRLLTKGRRDRMIDARTDDEALKLLTECGYAEPEDMSAPAVNRVLTQARVELMEDLSSALPDPALLDVFRIKYDYHNAKALLKAEAIGEDGRRLLMPGGRWDPQLLADEFHQGGMADFSETFRAAVREANRILAEERDPQRSDAVLDRACYAEMAQAAKQSGSPFLEGYVRLSVDAVNLRTAVRCARMGAGPALLSETLIPGGSVDTAAIAEARGADLAQRFRNTSLHSAAEAGVALTAPGSGSLTGFEKMCDNALTAYLAQAKRVPFGEQPVVAYVCAREAEATAVRTILAGRKAGMSGEAIRERLRDCYV